MSRLSALRWLAAVPLALSACTSDDGLARLEDARIELAALPAREALAAEPYVRGRLAVVWVKHERGGEPVYLLEYPPPEGDPLYATAPEEVGTVARLDCHRDPAGQYVSDDGETSAVMDRETCTLALADLSIPAVVHRDTFRGPEPPELTSAEEGTLGFQSLMVSVPDVKAALATLPRR